MNKPKLTLSGKEYHPKRPTMKVWRAIVEHDAETANLSIAELLAHRVEILSAIYGVDVEVNSLYDDKVRVCVPVSEIERKS